jgi:hypothetical protein
VNSPPPTPEVILTNFFAEPTVLLVPITSRVIKSPTSVKSSEFAFNKKIILFNGISLIKSGLFNIILLNKLFL